MAKREKSQVRSYVLQRLKSVSAKGAVIDRLTIPLGEYDHFQLVWLCERLGLSQSELASEFLRVAIEDAMDEIAPSADLEAATLDLLDLNPDMSEVMAHSIALQELPEDIARRREFDDKLYQAYKLWLDGGKRSPRPPADVPAEEVVSLEPLKLRGLLSGGSAS